jgi:hypothetical protein
MQMQFIPIWTSTRLTTFLVLIVQHTMFENLHIIIEGCNIHARTPFPKLLEPNVANYL